MLKRDKHVEVELQNLDSSALEKLKDTPPPPHVLQKLYKSLADTSDPKVE